MLALAALDRPLFVEWSHRVKYIAIDVTSYSFNALMKTECETFLKTQNSRKSTPTHTPYSRPHFFRPPCTQRNITIWRFRPPPIHKVSEVRRRRSGVRRSAVYTELDFEGHRGKGEVVWAFEALGEVTVAALLELEALQKTGERQEKQIHRKLFTGACSRTCRKLRAK